MKTKKGLSQIVSAVLLIAITLIVGVIIANSTNVFVKDKLEDAQSCFELFEKVKINNDFTCYDKINNRVQISLIVDEVEIESILIAINTNQSSFVFTLNEENQTITSVTNYPDDSIGVKMPAQESAKTYYVGGINEYPLKIEIAPKTEKTQCETIDFVETIGVC